VLDAEIYKKNKSLYFIQMFKKWAILTSVTDIIVRNHTEKKFFFNRNFIVRNALLSEIMNVISVDNFKADFDDWMSSALAPHSTAH